MQRLFKITVNGKEYDVAVQELTSGAALMPNYIGTPAAATPAAAPATAVPPAAPTVSAAAGAGDQCAQMGGVVAGILVKEGQEVKEGERLVELEAMKMKIPVTASMSGKVSRILVAVGDPVTAGQPLITLS
ncbi:MAG: acetyl-CoA carboxylase biotin carboxyl carrier protein subunit [Candidatus Accumulibacter sp.]|jgi:biotin carboxyl carrier protein|nr:acetyl-CoA carboxylase biotin carboxyl carrier protein subunit [Accumulibacter sp.]